MQGPGEEDEDFGEEKCEMIETILPADDGTHHEETSTAKDHRREKNDDLGMRRCRCVGREGELNVYVCV